MTDYSNNIFLYIRYKPVKTAGETVESENAEIQKRVNNWENGQIFWQFWAYNLLMFKCY